MIDGIVWFVIGSLFGGMVGVVAINPDHIYHPLDESLPSGYVQGSFDFGGTVSLKPVMDDAPRCERRGCPVAMDSDDGLCRCPWDDGTAHRRRNTSETM
jgi:hypothetical protein